ncbi:MAG TPA: hypothetical protein VNV88_07700 [Candidatus Solibacter sp.]|jgi:hypothetical protein|nr:hypothetical protein [Candidatus Solibacter sp.]
MNSNDWIAFGQVLTGAGTLALFITALIAYKSYAHQNNLERLKWLQQLYDSFYNQDRYKSVRQKIDFNDVEGLFSLLLRSNTEPQSMRFEERKQLDEFTDYLNFFEWIAFLESKGQLSFEDVDSMFNYYLKRVMQVDQDQQFRKYIQHAGYEKLHKLLNRYSRID